MPKGVRGFQKGHKLSPAQGRPPRAVELKAREFILECIKGDEGIKKIIDKVYRQAIKGSHKHQELLLHYILGKPTDKIKIEATGNIPASNPTVVKIIADNLRLDQLNKDVQAAPVISQDRINEMEKILNDAKDNGKE